MAPKSTEAADADAPDADAAPADDVARAAEQAIGPHEGGQYNLPLPIDEQMLHERLDVYGGFQLTVVEDTATVTVPGLNDQQLATILQQ